MSRQKNDTGTKQQILKAASLAFSQKGFRATTIADICQLAGTNIASVNYYFGDKETLYVESWRAAFRHAHEKHPIDGGVAPDAPAKERLRGWIVSLLNHIVDPECHDFEIVHMELANPTGLLFGAVCETIKSMQEGVGRILRDLLGKHASDKDIQLCEMSVRSQCMNPMIFGRRQAASPENLALPRPPFPDADISTIADHVIRFALGGLAAARRQIETRERTRRKRRG